MKTLILPTNKFNNQQSRHIRTRRGFSIVEVAIAMGVVTLLLTTFLGVFGPAQKNVQRALSTKDANRMKDSIQKEMSILRPAPTDTYSSSFEKAFEMIKNSHDSTKAVIIYQYRADASATSDSDGDGILAPYTGADGIQGKDYIIQTAVRTIGTSKIKAELGAVDGPVFAVRMTQLVKDPASTASNLILSAWTDASDDLIAGITDPDTPGAQLTVANYPKAVIAFRAEFFKVRVNKFDYIVSGNWDFESLGNPVTEINMAIRR